MDHLTVAEVMRNAKAVCGGDTAHASRFLLKNQDVQKQCRLVVCHDLDDPVLLAGVIHTFERVGQSVFLCPRLDSTTVRPAAVDQLRGAAWAVYVTLGDAEVMRNPPQPVEAVRALVGDRLAWMPLRETEPHKSRQWINWAEESGRAFVVLTHSRVIAIHQYASDYYSTNNQHVEPLGVYTGGSYPSPVMEDPS